MLEKLTVKNFVIIEDISVDFKSGMTVITGETGAGKSLIIDTINLLLGDRADNEMIRDGENYAYIEGVFSNTSKIDLLLEKYDIKKQDKITIERIISNSKNQIKINGVSVTLQILKSISKLLADIHVQNDTIKLFNPDNYLDLVDPKNDTKFDKLLNQYTKSLYDYENAYKTYDVVLKGQKETLDRLEFLEYEKNEIEELELYPNIDKELEHLTTLQCVLAKSVYDNFVDRGLIENDDKFQQMWYDFYFNNGPINTENAPKEYKDILAKVVAL